MTTVNVQKISEVETAQAYLDNLISAVVEHRSVSFAKATEMVLNSPDGLTAYAALAEARTRVDVAKNKPRANPRMTAGLEAELDNLTDDYARVHKLAPAAARTAALTSERGREIYAQIEAIRNGTATARTAALAKQAGTARPTGAKAELDAVIKRYADTQRRRRAVRAGHELVLLAHGERDEPDVPLPGLPRPDPARGPHVVSDEEVGVSHTMLACVA